MKSDTERAKEATSDALNALHKARIEWDKAGASYMAKPIQNAIFLLTEQLSSGTKQLRAMQPEANHNSDYLKIEGTP